MNVFNFKICYSIVRKTCGRMKAPFIHCETGLGHRDYGLWLGQDVAKLSRGVARFGRGVPNLCKGVDRLFQGGARLGRGVARLGRGWTGCTTV
jgi:hypothetical protein